MWLFFCFFFLLVCLHSAAVPKVYWGAVVVVEMVGGRDLGGISARHDNDSLGGLSPSSARRPIEASHYNQRPSSPLIRPLTNKL